MRSDKEILELLLFIALNCKERNLPFLMCKQVETLVFKGNFESEVILRAQEDRIMELLGANQVVETRIHDTMWYPIDDIGSRILNIKRAIDFLG